MRTLERARSGETTETTEEYMEARALASRAHVVLVGALLWASVATAAPSDEQIREILRQRIDLQQQSVGIVVGILEPGGRRVISYGALRKGEASAVGGDTLFGVGSVTKIFTALLLSDMAHTGEVLIDDPVNKYLPEGIRILDRGKQAITLVELATHTSGLPRTPTNFLPADPLNPFADYTTAQMYRFIATYEADGTGAPYQYSNIGYNLLGHVLTLRSRSNFESMVLSRICKPLGMKSTSVTVPPKLRSRLATGHNKELDPVANLQHTPEMVASGGIYSTANDLLRFSAAFLGYSSSRLKAPMAVMFGTRRQTPRPDSEIGLGWQILNRDGRQIVWKNGGNGGYRSYWGMDLKARIAVVVLSNTSTIQGVDDIGWHLLNPEAPLIRLPPIPEHITLEPTELDRYLGEYEARQGYILSVARDGARLFVHTPGQEPIELLARSAGDFFLTVSDARITFTTDAEGPATQMIVHDRASSMPAQRVDSERADRVRANFVRRIREQIPAPDSEAAVRRQIDSILRDGGPRYDDMDPALAETARKQWPENKSKLTDLGALRSISFKSVTPMGIDVFRVDFSERSFEWRVGLGADGKISEMQQRPLQPVR